MKFIVYVTTNVVNNKIYVGVHKTQNPEIFDEYIGCGVKINNPHSYNKAKTPFQFAVQKYGPNSFKRVVLRIFDTLEDALELEASIVDENFVKRHDTYNVALGGGMPPLTNKIIYQYSLDGLFIREWESIVCAEKEMGYNGNTLSIAVKYGLTGKGFLWTDYKVNRLDTSSFSQFNKIRLVYQYNISGEYVQEFKTITDAAKMLNTTTSNIQRSIKGGYKIQNFYFSHNLYSKYIPEKTKSLKNTNIHQYSLDGTYIKSYASIKDVALDFGKGCASGIKTSIRLGRAYKEFQWNADKVSSMKKLIPDKPKSRKIAQYTLDGEFVASFDTVTEAIKKFGHGVNKVLKGRQKQTKNFIFKYLN